MENYLENNEILSTDFLAVIDQLISNSKDIVFGGSIALNAVGVIKRPIKDIDLIILKGFGLRSYGLMDHVQKTEFDEISETTTDVNGILINRVSAKINNVNICIFQLEVLSYSEFSFLGRKIKIQNINDAILAKRCYSKKDCNSRDKHSKDVKEIESTIYELID